MNSSESSHESGQRAPATHGPFRSRRTHVLNVLAEAEKPMTAHEIADATDCALVTVRRHLNDLRRDGHICLAGQRPRLSADGRRLASRSPNEYARNHD